MKTRFFSFAFIFLFLLAGCGPMKKSQEKSDLIKAYDLDFNWGEGGPNGFPNPGKWTNVSPDAQIKWYKDLGVNTIQTFCVSCNGYAWYKNGVVPEQPGLKCDYLPEMVRLGHREGMRVFGYFCIGANTRWGMEHPDLSYGYPSDLHIPLTRQYMEYLDKAIRDAVGKTGIDGFMVDWFYQPKRTSTGGKWLACEKERYQELMDEPFPGEEKLSSEKYNAFSRLAIEKCWDVIHKAAKETNPNCLIWLTCNNITHPHYKDSKLFREVDWLMNEGGDLTRIDSIRSMVGKDTRLITCLADWNKQDPKSVVLNAIKSGVGLYGFAKPYDTGLLMPISQYLSFPVDSFKGDNKNIATFARVYNDLPLDFVQK
jgi:hypothetical protein